MVKLNQNQVITISKFSTLLERQQEGIQKVIQKGIYKGRLKGTKESSEKFISKYPHVVMLLKKENLSLHEISLIIKVSKSTVFKVNKYLNIRIFR